MELFWWERRISKNLHLVRVRQIGVLLSRPHQENNVGNMVIHNNPSRKGGHRRALSQRHRIRWIRLRWLLRQTGKEDRRKGGKLQRRDYLEDCSLICLPIIIILRWALRNNASRAGSKNSSKRCSHTPSHNKYLPPPKINPEGRIEPRIKDIVSNYYH